MHPMDERRFWMNVEGSVVKPQIMAIVRPQHHAMAKQADGIAVQVFGRMYNVNSGHVLNRVLSLTGKE
jgi:hypothetical protein